MKKLISLLSASVIALSSLPAVAVQTGFRDVPEDSNYADAVKYCRENNLMTGMTDTEFSPDTFTSRAMLMHILYRNAESPNTDATITFTDVAKNEWYYDAINWAVNTGIASGYDNEHFGPTDKLQKEQILSILWRIDGKEKIDVSLPYRDSDKISTYATDAIKWAFSKGIIDNTSKKLVPQENVTRGDMAVILYRYFNTQELTAIPDYDTFDNTVNYSGYTNNKSLKVNNTAALSASYDGTTYYYVDKNGNGYSLTGEAQTQITFKSADSDIIGYIDNMRIFKGYLFGIIKESAEGSFGRAFVCKPDGSDFKYFAESDNNNNTNCHNIITRTESGNSFIYLLDDTISETEPKTTLRKFEFKKDTAELIESEEKNYENIIYSYSITDDYEMYIDKNSEGNFVLHCRKHNGNTENETIKNANFSAYSLNNDGSNFYTFKKGAEEGSYIPCCITKDALDKLFTDNTNFTADIAKDAPTTTKSYNKLTVCKNDKGETHIYYYDNTKYSEIKFASSEPAPISTAAPILEPEYDTFDNTSNYSGFFWNNDKKLNLNEKNGMNGGYSLSYDGTKYYYVSESGKGYGYIEDETPEEISFITSEGDNINTLYPEYYIDNMRIFKGCLFGIMKESADEGLGRAFVCNPDGSSFKFFAVRQDGGRDYSHNIMARNENGKSFIYLLDSTNEKTDLRKFEVNNGVATETNGRTFDKRLYAYSITDEYEMYTDYYGFGLHCIRRSDGKTIDAGFAAYRLNNDGLDFYTFKKITDEAAYIPCRFSKKNLAKAFSGSADFEDIAELSTTVGATASIKRLTVCKDNNGKTQIYYFSNTDYSELNFPN